MAVDIDLDALNSVEITEMVRGVEIKILLLNLEQVTGLIADSGINAKTYPLLDKTKVVIVSVPREIRFPLPFFLSLREHERSTKTFGMNSPSISMNYMGLKKSKPKPLMVLIYSVNCMKRS